MDIFPLNLVLAAALASAMIFLGVLPPRLLRAPVFRRQILFAGLAWMVVALLSPPAILHYHILFGLVCLWAWRQLRHDNALSGKFWLTVATGLGLSLGVVLILAVTPRAFPPGLGLARQVLLLSSVYLGGGVIGLAYVLYIFTRREATRAEVPKRTVDRGAALLLVLIFLRAVVLLATIFLAGGAGNGVKPGREREIAGILAAEVLIVPLLGFVARWQAHSLTPSTSGWALLGICAFEAGAELLARMLLL
jgi:hypothetical protein